MNGGVRWGEVSGRGREEREKRVEDDFGVMVRLCRTWKNLFIFLILCFLFLVFHFLILKNN